MLQPFIWNGNTGGIKSPAQVERERLLAESLLAPKKVATNGWEGAAQLAQAISGSVLRNRADEAQAAGSEKANALLSGITASSSPDQIIQALTSQDAQWLSPGQSSIGEALLTQGLKRSDPTYSQELTLGDLKIQREKAEIDALLNPEKEPLPYEVIDGQVVQIDPMAGTTRSLGDFDKPDSPLVTVNNGDTNDFYKALDADAGKQVQATIDAGRNATSNNIKLGQLSSLLGTAGTAPQGAAGAITQFASSLGIPLEGADELQAAQALINQMVPLQRPPGSGTMSDADLALFKASLPQIMNQPGGNQQIIDTARKVNEYYIEQARIAELLATRQITREEAADLQRAVPNPLETQAGSTTNQTTPGGQSQMPKISSEAEYQNLKSGETYVAPDGSIRTKQ